MVLPRSSEAPVALEFNGLAYAVMMATPADLEDFALGFALTEGLAKAPSDLSDIAVAEVEKGWIVRASLTGLGITQLTERVRARVAESSCGLCGIENLDAVAKPLPQVPAHDPLDEAAIFRALGELRDHQPLGKATGAAHAAAFTSLRRSHAPSTATIACVSPGTGVVAGRSARTRSSTSGVGMRNSATDA